MVRSQLIAILTASALVAPLATWATPGMAMQPASQDTNFAPTVTPETGSAQGDERLAAFTPTSDPIRHRIDYEIWDLALKNLVLPMGPSTRQGAARTEPPAGTRLKHGPQSRYRLEGSMVLFRFFDDAVISSFAEYRKDLEQVTETLDIAALPRNEQLAFWLNLHNVALMEQISKEWPVRQPAEITLDGVKLDEAKFMTVRGIPVSLRDIRENIVFRHWKDPKVIYGFWRGEIGGPHLQPVAYTGANVSSLLDLAAADFVNSLRGTQSRGDRLEVSALYAEVAPFYFSDFESDLRTHLADYADEPVAELLSRTRQTRASISEPDIADLHGGARPPSYLQTPPGCSTAMGAAACDLVEVRERKLESLKRRGKLTGRVYFSHVDLPGDPPNKNAVE
jgi:Protein of unknown function, DUF547